MYEYWHFCSGEQAARKERVAFGVMMCTASANSYDGQLFGGRGLPRWSHLLKNVYARHVCGCKMSSCWPATCRGQALVGEHPLKVLVLRIPYRKPFFSMGRYKRCRCRHSVQVPTRMSTYLLTCAQMARPHICSKLSQLRGSGVTAATHRPPASKKKTLYH